MKSLSYPSLIQAVNEFLESLGAPLEIVDGFVSSISVTIPWQALLTDHCTLEVLGLQITCRPKYRTSEFTQRLFGSTLMEPYTHTHYSASTWTVSLSMVTNVTSNKTYRDKPVNSSFRIENGLGLIITK